MSSYPASSSTAPQFSNPWGSSSSPPNNHGLYVHGNHGLHPALGLDRSHTARTSTSSSASSLGSYGQIPVTAASAGSLPMADPLPRTDVLTLPQDVGIGINRMQPTSAASHYPDSSGSYASSASPVNAPYAASPTPYESMGYAPAPVRSAFALAPEQDHARRFSHPSVPSASLFNDADPATYPRRPPHRDSGVDFCDRGVHDNRRSFADAIDAGHGMLAMSQETPRPIYGAARHERGSGDSYGFPSTHSTSSSVSSSAGGFGNYYGADSVSDYSTSDIESVTSRTLPRPHGLLNQAPPAPSSMMGQFSSKVSSSTQKKHKCKVCDKRFTRPSSLQTHMYSHTGEKRTLMRCLPRFTTFVVNLI